MSLEGGAEWLDRIRRARKPPAQCLRVFVSHRKADEDAALRLAWLAQDKGWGYWLDIVDLKTAIQQLAALTARLSRQPTLLELSNFTTSLIEMGLFNCTHVISATTRKTKGSQWVPYEYGRLKEVSLVPMNAGSWSDSTTIPKKEDLAGYVHLAPVLETEAAINAWLGAEMSKAVNNRYPNCPGRPRSDWPRHILPPGTLPTG